MMNMHLVLTEGEKIVICEVEYIKDLILESERTVGQDNKHLKFVCVDKKNNTADCVFWNCSSLNIP